MADLLSVIKRDFDEFHSSGKIERAKALTRITGMHMNHNEYPEYFFGDLNAKFVLVHLMPKQNDNLDATYQGELKFQDFTDYVIYYQHFGENHYGKSLKNRRKSIFDTKQVHFILPFNALNLSADDEFVNLQRVIDDKLQLELVPFGSSSFKTDLMTHEALQPYIELLLDTIIKTDRDYVIFCGKVFESLLRARIVKKEDYSFKLIKADGSLSKNNARFSRLTLRYKGQEFKAGIAHSFAQQGLTGAVMEDYGKKCCERYDQ
ncbi:hypothetical protein [Psychrobacter celer]|uniref:hypothetical protein n=1 Tax=Psychrobacter celer TaxID=306572 RepID=UPI003FCFF7FB